MFKDIYLPIELLHAVYPSKDGILIEVGSPHVSPVGNTIDMSCCISTIFVNYYSSRTYPVAHESLQMLNDNQTIIVMV